MNRYLFDSNAMSEFIANREPFCSRVIEAKRQGHRIGTCEPVITELYYGLEFSGSRELNLERLNRALSGIRVWPFDRAAAIQTALVMAELKRKAIRIQMIDMMIAGIALALGNTTIVSTDTDFLHIPDVIVENWTVKPAGG